VFLERFEIDLADFILESEQGSGLAKFARKQAFTYRFSIRHFLAQLEDRVLGFLLITS
jgi:hypothetical protein